MQRAQRLTCIAPASLHALRPRWMILWFRKNLCRIHRIKAILRTTKIAAYFDPLLLAQNAFYLLHT